MHQALLQHIVKLVSNLPVDAVVPGTLDNFDAAEISRLVTSGELFKNHATSGKNDHSTAVGSGNRSAWPIDGMGPDYLAWGGADIVVFVRHNGLLISGTADVVRVQHPPGNGPWCGFESPETAAKLPKIIQHHCSIITGTVLAVVRQQRNSRIDQPSTCKPPVHCCGINRTSSH